MPTVGASPSAGQTGGRLGNQCSGGVTIIGPDELERGDRSEIRLGVPNRGRMYASVSALVERAYGIDIRGRGMIFRGHDGPEVVCARSGDLPGLLTAGLVDVAITGYDYAVDSGHPVTDVGDLGYLAGQVAVLIPADQPWDPDRVELLASQYPRLATQWWRSHGRAGRIVALAGAAELYPQIGAVDAIVDVVASGETAGANGLRPVEWIMPTSARIFLRAGETAADLLDVVARLCREADGGGDGPVAPDA